MSRQRDLHLGAYPALHAVPADQHDEGGTPVQCVLEACHPAVTDPDRVFVLEDAQSRLLQRRSQGDARLPVSTAVAEEYLLGRDRCVARHAGDVFLW